MTEYANPDALVDTDWLEQNLNDPNTRIIEVDEDTAAYEKGHIPGAVAWNWFKDLHDPLKRDYVDQAGLSALLRKAGVGPDTTVVLYGGNNNWFASYAYWLLRYLGFDNVRLLNGGRQKWELESRELVAGLRRVSRHRHRRVGRRPRGDPLLPRRRPVEGGEQDRVRGCPVARGVPRREARSRSPSAGAGPGPRAHPRRDQRPVGEGGQRGRHVQECRRAPGPVRGRRVGDRDRTSSRTAGSESDRATRGSSSTSCWGSTEVRNYDGSWTEYGSLVGAPVER